MDKLNLYIFPFKALGGSNELQLYHKDKIAAEEVAQIVINSVKEIEEKYSRYKEESIISKINRAAGNMPVEVDEETAALLDYAMACHKQSGGLFDITSGILRQAWDFKSQTIPSQEKIDRLLPLIGWDKVEWNRPEIYLSKAGMQIDFGGIGKEFAVDRAAGLLHEMDVSHALINLGGDIRITGPHPDGKPWNVGIQHPRVKDSAIDTIYIMQGAVTTSGDYERFIEVNGKRYSHILNPKTGWPVESFQSVTLIAESCLVAGSICTIAMLKGEKDGLDFLNASRRQSIAVTNSGKILRSGFSPSQML